MDNLEGKTEFDSEKLDNLLAQFREEVRPYAEAARKSAILTAEDYNLVINC
jgi:hypothetical protein